MSSSDRIRTLIVDDESLARDTIRLLLEDESDFDVVGECSDGSEAVDTIRSVQPDLVFLDVQMPGLTGLDVVSEIGVDRMPAVVFATAFDEYAVQAFETSAIDYLVKPFSDERFETTLRRVRAMIRQKQSGDLENRLRRLLESTGRTGSAPQTAQRFMVKERGSIQVVEADDIEWIEAAGDYVILHVAEASHMIRETMSSMEDKLDENRFQRIHRSTIVNLSCIRELKPFFHGDYVVYLLDGTELKLSRRYWSRVEEALSS